MIIFYNKNTGDLYGTIGGYDHTEENSKKLIIKPSDIDESLIGKYIVPTKPKLVEIIDPEDTNGEKKIVVQNGFSFETKFASVIDDINSGKKQLSQLKADIDDVGNIVSFTEKPIVKETIKNQVKNNRSPIDILKDMEKRISELSIKVEKLSKLIE